MELTIVLPTGHYQVNLAFPWSLAIGLDFNHQQPNHFGAQKAASTPMQAGNFVGNTEQGGSCNVNELSFNPHCNGTHTETLAHICDTNHPMSQKIADINLPPLMPCVLISLHPEPGHESGDDYQPAFEKADMIISRQALHSALQTFDDCQLQAVVIRTLPNGPDKRFRAYDENHQPAFLSRDAVRYLNERGVEHLILDIPSIDRLYDDGLMTAHHTFWQVPLGSHQPGPNSLIHKTITEMAFIDNPIPDGFYFVNLQTPAFVNDAAPSRPVIYAAETISTEPKKNTL